MKTLIIGASAAALAATLIGGALRAQSRMELSSDAPQGTVTEMGGTYYALESKAKKVTTRFRDGSSAVAERRLDGRIKTRLSDSSGAEVSTLDIDHDKALRSTTEGASTLQAAARSGVHPTLDWANVQAHTLWNHSGRLAWQGDFLQGQGKTGVVEIEEVEAEFENGLLARTLRAQTEFESVLTRDGAELGRVKWLPKEQVLAWRFPGLTEGFLTPARLQAINGWTFTPTMAWANIQALAFYEFHLAMPTQGALARSECTDDKNWLQRTVNAIFPTVYANDPGCDYLHWLDNSILRPCCDRHDQCFAKEGCGSWSWFFLYALPYWSCTQCNQTAAICFGSGGGYEGPYYLQP